MGAVGGGGERGASKGHPAYQLRACAIGPTRVCRLLPLGRDLARASLREVWLCGGRRMIRLATTALLLACAQAQQAELCSYDVDQTGRVDVGDLLVLLSEFGTSDADDNFIGSTDLDANGAVNVDVRTPVQCRCLRICGSCCTERAR
jgi:hypothetical protein|eukprot:COSAG02_NODE_24397_length_689_cov_1.615254_2_plen_147_part_00